MHDRLTQHCSAGIGEGNALLSGRLDSESKMGVPKQYALPQASWSVGTGVHIPNPQPSAGLQQQLNALHPGLAPIRTQSQYDSTAYSSALQKQIAQAGRPSNLPVGAASLAGQYGFPQLAAQPTSRFQQAPASANSAQLQALLAQLNHSRQQAPPYHAAALPQQIPSLQTQLAHAREVSRPYGQNLSSLAAANHLQTPASTLQGGMSRLGPPPTLQQNSSLTPAHYQALLRSLPSNNTSQLDQLLQSGNPLSTNSAAGLAGLPSQGLGPSAAEDTLQAYLTGLANPAQGYSHGTQNVPSVLPGAPSAAASLQYQMPLNNSLASQRPMLPGSGRPPSMLGGNAASMDVSSLQPSRSPGPPAFHGQAPLLDRGTEPGSTDFRHLQQLLAASGKDMSVDLLLKLQREMSQRGPAEIHRAAEPANAELQRLLAGLGQNQPPLSHSQPLIGHGQQTVGQSHLPRELPRNSNLGLGRAQAERDPIVQLRKQLSAQVVGMGSGQAEAPPGDPSSKGPVETPFAQEAQHVPQGQSTFLDAFGRASRQSNRPEPTTADNLATALSHRSFSPASMQHQPSAAHPRMQHLAPAAADVEAKPKPSGWPDSQPPQLQRGDSSVAASMEVQAGIAPVEGDAPRSEPSARDWGPFTGLGSASTGAPWSQPWGPVAPEQAKLGQSRLGQATASNRAASRGSELDAQQPQVSGLSSFFQASNKQQKLGDTDWQAQLASLQNASRAQLAQGSARYPSGSELFARPAEQQAWPGSSSAHPTPGAEAKAPSSSLFADYKRPDSRQSIEQESMIPSWLQTTSHGSGVWGAPNQGQQHQPGSNPSS